jgi:undecaprenyl diphosphate synthase
MAKNIKNYINIFLNKFLDKKNILKKSTHNNIPKHVAYIVDGNGRWATEKNLDRSAGHKKGADIALDIIKTTFDRGAKYVTLYLFSIENWSRPTKEVNYIMELLEHFLINTSSKFKKNNVSIRIIGKFDKLSENIQKIILENNNEELQENVLILAISYSGKNDIIETCKSLIDQNINSENITEEVFSKNTSIGKLDIPDPDIIIRTSGELRLSNFYLWQASYSELYFCKKYWPDLNNNDIKHIFKEYAEKRKRRFGKV